MASSCRVGKIQKRIVLQIGSKTHNKIGIIGVTAIPLCLLCTSLIPDNSNMLVSTASGYTLCSGKQLSRMIDKFRDGDKFSQKRAELTVYFTLLQRSSCMLQRSLFSGTCRVWSVRGIVSLSRPQGCLHGIKVGLLLELANVFLVADSLVAKPVGDLAEKTEQYHEVNTF